MKKSILLVLLIFLGMGCSAPVDKEGEPAATRILKELNDGSCLLTVETVAERLIAGDPGLMLVDVRKAEDFRYFSLPGAVNLPLPGMLEEDRQAKLEDDRYDIVFFSNDALLAEQAWMLNRRLGRRNIYVMEGGLNRWAENILAPQEPGAVASAEEWEQYRFRKAACQYFIGQSGELAPEPYVQPVQVSAAPKTIEVKPKKKAAEEEEGC